MDLPEILINYIFVSHRDAVNTCNVLHLDPLELTTEGMLEVIENLTVMVTLQCARLYEGWTHNDAIDNLDIVREFIRRLRTELELVVDILILKLNTALALGYIMDDITKAELTKEKILSKLYNTIAFHTLT